MATIHKCTCGKVLTKAEYELNKDMCTECVNDLADDIDRDMLGDESFDYFKNTGYFDDHEPFGDK